MIQPPDEGAQVIDTTREGSGKTNKLAKLLRPLSSPQETHSRQGRGGERTIEALSVRRPIRHAYRPREEVWSHVVPEDRRGVEDIADGGTNAATETKLIASQIVAEVRQAASQTFLALVVHHRPNLSRLAAAVDRTRIGAVGEALEEAEE